jgi:hypothetical protein
VLVLRSQSGDTGGWRRINRRHQGNSRHKYKRGVYGRVVTNGEGFIMKWSELAETSLGADNIRYTLRDAEYPVRVILTRHGAPTWRDKIRWPPAEASSWSQTLVS